MADEEVDTRSQFPSYSFPFYRDGQSRQNFIDYGCTSTLNIDLDSRGNFLSNAKQQRTDGKTYFSLHPTVPLMPPNKTSLTSKDIPDVHERLAFKRTDHKQTIALQVHNFAQDHPDIQFCPIVSLLHEEFDSTSCSCFSLSKRAYLPFPQFEKPHGNACKICDLLVSSNNEWLSRKLTTNKLFIDSFSQAVGAVPFELLHGLIEESFTEQKNENLYFDILQGNLLAYCTSNYSSFTAGVLVYPSGPCLETLNVSFVNLTDFGDVNSNSVSSKPKILSTNKAYEVQGPLRQLDATFVGTELWVTTRSRYNCNLFKGTGTPEQFSLEPLESLACKVTPCSISTNPYIPGEAVVVMETGEAYLWKPGKQLDSIHIMPVSPEEDHPWYQCVYGQHPRSALLANSIVADLVDFRVKSPSQTRLFSITASHLNVRERFSAIQRHPVNTHHYLLATDQSLLLMDDRFVQHPALSWRHHLEDPIQFMEVMSHNQDNIVMMSGSVHRQTHCLVYKDCGTDPRFPVAFGGRDTVQPPVSYGLPWKLTPYDDWPSHLPKSYLPLSSAITQRLAAPLVGLCGIPISTSSHNNGFTTIQLSALGDLFYQPFLDKAAVYQYKENTELTEEMKTGCKQWIDNVIAMDTLEKTKQPWPLESNNLKANCYPIFSIMTNLCEPHKSCKLCRDTSYVAFEEDTDGDEVCPRCGFTIRFGAQLHSASHGNKITTRRSLEMGEGSKHYLSLMDDLDEYKDPLSKNLMYNWNEDIPRPTNFDEKQVEGDEGNVEGETRDAATSERHATPAKTGSSGEVTPNVRSFQARQSETSELNQRVIQEELNRAPDAPSASVRPEEMSSLPSPVRLQRLGKHSPIRQVLSPPGSPQKARTAVKKVKRNLGNTMGF